MLLEGELKMKTFRREMEKALCLLCEMVDEVEIWKGRKEKKDKKFITFDK